MFSAERCEGQEEKSIFKFHETSPAPAGQPFCRLVSLDERGPKDHLLRRIDRFVTAALADIHERLEPYYSDIGRP